MIRVSNSLDSDQARHFVGPDLGPNCLQRLSADDTSIETKSWILIDVYIKIISRQHLYRDKELNLDRCIYDYFIYVTILSNTLFFLQLFLFLKKKIFFFLWKKISSFFPENKNE